MYDWLLFLHVSCAFAMVAGELLFATVFIARARLEGWATAASLSRLSNLGEVTVTIGSIGVLVLGIWLAIYVDGYELWDGWIVAAIVLWAIYGAAGTRSRRVISRARDGAAELSAADSNTSAVPRVLALRVLIFAAILLLLLDMIFKPGA